MVNCAVTGQSEKKELYEAIKSKKHPACEITYAMDLILLTTRLIIEVRIKIDKRRG